MRRTHFLTVAALLALAAAPAHALVLNVPSEYTTIQAAMDAAGVGDTVLVAPGTYMGPGNVDLNPHGVDMVVRGIAGRESTIIDCEHELEMRGLTIESGETRAMVFEGFTILRGYPISVGMGGGINITDSSPTLRNLRVEDCISGYGHYNSYGGGLYSVGGAPLISDVELVDNHGLYGIGAQVAGPAVLEDIVAMFNDGSGSVYAAYGGGLRLHGECVLRRSLIMGNRASFGGGLACSGGARVEDTVIAGNTGAIGAGIALQDSATVMGCTVVGNVDSYTYETNGIIYQESGDCDVRRTIVTGSTGEDLPFFALSGKLTIADCCMFGNEGPDTLFVSWGIDSEGGNVVADPLFCDAAGGDYGLAWNSPCVAWRSPGGELVGACPPACSEVPSFAWIAGAATSRAGALTVLHATGEYVDELVAGDDLRSCVTAPDGTVWVASAGTQELTHLSSDGAELGVASLPGVPGDLVLDRSGDPWVVLPEVDSITHVDGDAIVVGTYPVGANPVAIAADHDGDVWVANAGSNNVTEVDGETGAGTAHGTVASPAGIAVGHENSVWVALGGSSSVIKFDGHGDYVGTYAVGDGPGAMAVDLSNRVWVACGGSDEIVCLEADGTPVSGNTITLPPAVDPVALAIDRHDHLWVLDGAQGEVRIYELDGTLLGTADAGASPTDIAIGVACPPTSVPGDTPASVTSLSLSISPNPVRSTGTTLAFRLPAGVERAAIRICDVAGRVVREATVTRSGPASTDGGTAVDGEAGADGETTVAWSWDCCDAAGSPVASGVYFCSVVAAAGESAEAKLVVVR